jgi:hypothetical protein
MPQSGEAESILPRRVILNSLVDFNNLDRMVWSRLLRWLNMSKRVVNKMERSSLASEFLAPADAVAHFTPTT